MADIQLHTHTQDIEITAPQTKDVVIGSPMDKGGVLPITKNGKYVVSDYDLAEVDVQPLPAQTKEVTITKNGTKEVTPDEGRLLNKVVVKTDTTESVILNFLNNGGTFAYSTFDELPKFDWSKLDKPNYNYFLYRSKNLTNDVLQNFMNLYTDDKSFSDATIFNDDAFGYNDVTELNLIIPKGFKNSKKQNILPTNIGNLTKIKQVTIDCNDSLEYSGTLLGWSYGMTLTLLNTKNLKTCYTPTSEVNINRFYAGSLITVPFNNVYNRAAYFGGFTDLGKGLKQNGSANAHTMTFGADSKATRESILNIFNDLYDLSLLDFTFVNAPTIRLGTTVWKRVTDDDIKIATDKGWTVTQ